MNEARIPNESGLTLKGGLLYALGAVAAFHLAYTFHGCSFLIFAFLWCVFQLTGLKTTRQAVYLGLATGLLAYGPQLDFFWNIFGPAAVALWFVPACWLSLFAGLGRWCRRQFNPFWAALLIPFLWTGLEYFRSELYYLRFSWLNAGYVFSQSLSWLPFKLAGMYGIGFALMAMVSLAALLRFKPRLMVGVTILAGLGVLAGLRGGNRSRSTDDSPGNLRVAGAQLEFPSEKEVIFSLNRLIKKYPEAQLLVLSEYTFTGPVPEQVKEWCKKNQRYLIIGAEDPVSNSQYYDTAFVISPASEIVFRQGKCVPIQFFKDGLPAREQKLWESPWGRIGICICYDLSYSRVTDKLIRLGAQGIIVPTMDVVDWGRHQHEMHARVAPVRAAEYGVPIFRLASSGISQCVNANGEVTATAPMPGDEAMMSGFLDLRRAGTLPLDRTLAPVCVAVTGLIIVWMAFVHFARKTKPNPP